MNFSFYNMTTFQTTETEYSRKTMSSVVGIFIPSKPYL